MHVEIGEPELASDLLVRYHRYFEGIIDGSLGSWDARPRGEVNAGIWLVKTVLLI